MEMMKVFQNLFVMTWVVCSTFAQGCAAKAPPRGQGPLTQNAIRFVGSMGVQRAAHTATLINANKVLIAGGFVTGGEAIASAEIFDATTQSFARIGSMSVARAGHSATKLPDGKILIAGGFNGQYLDTAEIYDPLTGKFQSAGRMVSPRSGHTATLVNDGTVLFAGGVGTGWTFLASAEIYDPKTGRFTPTGSMTTERESHTASMLKDGRVLITGGHNGRRAAITIYRSSEIYDPRLKTFSPVGDLVTKRHKHEAIPLDDGRVLVLGGSDERDGDGAYRGAEIFDPRTKTFGAVGQMMARPRYKLQGAVVKLNDGKILIAGGSDRAEIFDPAANAFVSVNGEMGSNRLFSTATLLDNGQVLIAGGYHSGSNNVSNGAWIFST